MFLDTFEESFRNNMFLFFFAISSLFIASIALALNMDIVSGAISGVTFFGEELEIPRMTVPQFINAVQAGMATSTLFPLMIQKGSIELLLCRPVPLWRLMVARFLGGHCDHGPQCRLPDHWRMSGSGAEIGSLEHWVSEIDDLDRHGVRLPVLGRDDAIGDDGERSGGIAGRLCDPDVFSHSGRA
jgi:hypothetical protein